MCLHHLSVAGIAKADPSFVRNASHKPALSAMNGVTAGDRNLDAKGHFKGFYGACDATRGRLSVESAVRSDRSTARPI